MHLLFLDRLNNVACGFSILSTLDGDGVERRDRPEADDVDGNVGPLGHGGDDDWLIGAFMAALVAFAGAGRGTPLL